MRFRPSRGLPSIPGTGAAEELEVVTVDEQDVDIFLRKELGKLDAAEACTDNDNTWFLLILLHDKSSPKTPTNEWRMAKIIA